MVSIETVQNEYNQALEQILPNVTKNQLSTAKRLTISKCIESLLIKFPDEQPSYLWKLIEKAHIISYVNDKIVIPENLSSTEFLSYILEDNVLTLITSASQSWKRSSGVAWEESLKDTLILSDETQEIVIISPVEMKILLNGGTKLNKDNIAATLILPENNGYRQFLDKLLDDKNFDLFILHFFPLTKQWKLFGLIQCKTSIRDRIKINMKSSEEAMQHHLWSIVIAMDPDGFTKNGGQYNRGAKNSWNGFYILDNNASRDESVFYGNLQRIQELIKSHCHEVLTSMLLQTDSINQNWRPKL